MNPNGGFERTLESWLEAEALTAAPVGLHDSVVDRARRSRQRAGWLVAMRGGTLGSVRTIGGVDRRVAYLLVVLALVVVALVVAVVVGAFRSDPFLPLGRNGAITFTVQGNNHSGNYTDVMNADGTGDQRVSSGTCPTYSMDGSLVASMSSGDATADLVVTTADGVTSRRVPIVPDYSRDSFRPSYALSPDGTQVAWMKPLRAITSVDGTEGAGWKNELWVATVAGGPAFRIVPASADPNESFGMPLWSPDGRHLAFEGNIAVLLPDTAPSHRSAIYVVDSDGSELHPLTTRPATNHIGMSWSPDGRSIAYLGLPDGTPLPASIDNSTTFTDPPLDIFVIGCYRTVPLALDIGSRF